MLRKCDRRRREGASACKDRDIGTSSPERSTPRIYQTMGISIWHPSHLRHLEEALLDQGPHPLGPRPLSKVKRAVGHQRQLLGSGGGHQEAARGQVPLLNIKRTDNQGSDSVAWSLVTGHSSLTTQSHLRPHRTCQASSGAIPSWTMDLANIDSEEAVGRT